MLTRLALILALFTVFGLTGCHPANLKHDTLINPGYWVRHAAKVLEDAHLFRVDIDRVVFGLEDVPVEEY